MDFRVAARTGAPRIMPSSPNSDDENNGLKKCCQHPPPGIGTAKQRHALGRQAKLARFGENIAIFLGQRLFNLAAERFGGAAFPLEQSQLVPQANDPSLLFRIHGDLLDGAVVNEPRTKCKLHR